MTHNTPGRPLVTAEILAVGSELTVGDTRDTNAGDLARDLSRAGVRVGRLTVLPDHLATVRDAFAASLERADLVVSTGGLGPTPDDLTREAIADALGRDVAVDPALETWLRDLWSRRGMAFPTLNLKQAWLVNGATAVPNPNGTAPGWWVDAGDGRVVVALPGPPREMRPMWRDWVLPRLRERGLGKDHVARTYRLTGIGESALADLLGEGILRRANPEVATYARAEAVDVRISAEAETEADAEGTGTISEHGGPGTAAPAERGRGRSAEDLVREAEARVLPLLAAYIWGREDETWATAIGRRLEARGWTLAVSEIGTAGSLVGLLGGAPWLRSAEVLASRAVTDVLGENPIATADPEERTAQLADTVRIAARSDVGLAVEATESGRDMTVDIAVASPAGTTRERRTLFMGGPQGRLRAALTAAAVLWAALPEASPAEKPDSGA